MALKKQTLSIPFARGLDQKTSDFRDSSTVIGDTVPKGKSLTFTTGANIYSYDEDLLVADGGRLYHKSGDTGLQDAGSLIDCTYSRSQIYSDESKKIGQVRSVRVTRSGIDYDVMAWVQTEPITIASYEICIAVRDVKSGAYFRKPYVLETVNRDSNTGDIDKWSCAPSIHLVKVSDEKIILVFRRGNSTSTVSDIKYAFIPDFITTTFDSSILKISVAGSLSNLNGVATCIDVALSGDSTSLFISYYTQASASGSIDDIQAPRIAKFTIGLGTLTFVSEKEVYKTVGPDVSFLEHDYRNYFYGNGYIPGICLHSDGTDLLICFNANGEHPSGRMHISIWCAKLSESLAQSSDSFQDAELQNKVLANGGFVTGSFKTKGFITAVQGNSNSINKAYGEENNNYASSLFQLGGTTYGGVKIKSYDLTGSHHGAVAGTGSEYVRFYSLNATGVNFDTPSGVAWIRWNSSGKQVYLSIIEPGAGFRFNLTTGKIYSTEEANIQTWINQQLGVSWFVLPTGTLDADTFGEDVRAPLHEILHLDFDTSTTGFDDVSSVHQNATVVSDPIVATVAGNTEILVAASRTNDNIGDANTFEFLTDADGVIHGTSITGNASYNVTSEYASMTGTHVRLFDGASIVDSVSGNFEYSTNTLVKTFLSSSDNSQEGYVKHHEQIFAPSRCVLDLSPDRSLPGINGGTSFLIGSGTLFSYDGEELVENGYYESPSIRSIVSASTTVDSRLTAGEFYSYSVVYEFVDKNGNLHESPPVAAVEVQTATNFEAVALRIPTFDATRKNANRISIYRSTWPRLHRLH
jgi:hypothetical protein